ncbi:MAG: class II aldolase/adducin family protein, partial [Clostridia bacterium]|nr:class II aldolase/adducin family protein [Clostridia bacterium]
MDILEAKEIVIKAGHELLKAGLIVRTWGNISCRIDDKSFVITPSGKAYDTLTPDDIVLVNIADLSYDGDVKPSSEKGIHASCYELRPDMNFVIHTHQKNASVVSTLGI